MNALIKINPAQGNCQIGKPPEFLPLISTQFAILEIATNTATYQTEKATDKVAFSVS
jgi:hypothetical protein